MTISKSLPIQFFLTGDPTYNEAEICGVYPDCFCEHVNYGEYITLQFNHSAALTLRAYDQDGNLLSSQAMTSLGSNYYQLKFKPNEFIANEIVKVIRFTVVNGSGTELAKSGYVVIGGCLTEPETAALTFFKYESGRFYFTLSVPLFNPVVISVASILGSNSSFCLGGGGNDNIGSGNQITLFPGETAKNGLGISPIIGGPTTYYRRGSSITVNGISRTNLQPITIGGTSVTVVIDNTCTPY